MPHTWRKPYVQGRPRVAFIYPNPRAALTRDIAAGREPDTALLGQNHLGEHGIDAYVHDPALARRGAGRVRWNLRELVLPLELRQAHAVFTPLAALLPLAARPLGPPVVVLNYGLNLIYRRASAARRRLLRASLRAARSVVCLGESQRRELLELTGLPAEHMRVALFGVDAEWWSPRPEPVPAPEPYVLAVGRDLARDYETLARAAEGLDLRVEIAAFARNVDGVRLPANVRRIEISAVQLREQVAGAAAIVVAQRRDGYPFGSEGGGLTTSLEAMAMARPLVVSDRAILRDYVRDGETALVVPPEDPAALRAAIERAVDDPGTLGAAARARVEAELTTRHFAARIAPIVHEAAGA